MYVALGIIFLIAELIIAGFLVFSFVRAFRNKSEPISKKNLLYYVPAFLLVYFMYLTAVVYKDGKVDFFDCYSIAGAVLEFFRFKGIGSYIFPIVEEQPLFYADFVIACIVSSGTLILSVASLFGYGIRNAAVKRAVLKNGGDIVMGNSPDAIKYLKANKNCLMWGTSLTPAKYRELIKSGICVIKAPLNSRSVAKKLSRGVHNVIVFRDGGYSYSELISVFGNMKKEDGAFAYLHLEADRDEKRVIREKFLRENKTGASFVSCFDKYELTARQFVADYPVSAYVPREFFNKNCTLKAGKEINVVFVGFGKVNYEIFKMCAMQFQFAGEEKGRLYSKPVHYHVFDRNPPRLSNEMFSRLLYEFDEDFAECGFPKPDKVCDLKEPSVLDVNSVEVRKALKALVSGNSFTFFVVSLENDFEDAACAHTVSRLFRGSENYRIFVRAKNNTGDKLVSDGDKIIYFGEEKLLYSHEAIVNNYLTELAQRINLLYNAGYGPDWLKETQKLKEGERYGYVSRMLSVPEHVKFMLTEWEKRPVMEQYANLYNALSLPFKLGLLGFKAQKREEGAQGVTEEEFNSRYVNSGKASGYNDYSYYFKTESGNVLAFCEHARWNAHYILSDYIQMSKEEMLKAVKTDENGKITAPHKDTENKKHACLTTYEGLDELIKFKYSLMYPNADINSLSPTDESLCRLGKLYAYDYMDLDRLYSVFESLGYSIVKL